MCCPVWGVLWGLWAAFVFRPCVRPPVSVLPFLSCLRGGVRWRSRFRRWLCAVAVCVVVRPVVGSARPVAVGRWLSVGGGWCAVSVLARLFYFGRFSAFVLNITFLCHSCAPIFFSLRHPQLDFSKMLFVK